MRIPKFIENCIQSLYGINLWFSKENSFSDWHYDSHDNFMCVFNGVKKVFIRENGVIATGMDYHLGKGEGKGIFFLHFLFLVKIFIVNKDQMLYIPQGYYHKVKSSGNNIFALNFWFNSVYNKFNHLENYHFNYLLNEVVLK